MPLIPKPAHLECLDEPLVKLDRNTVIAWSRENAAIQPCANFAAELLYHFLGVHPQAFPARSKMPSSRPTLSLQLAEKRTGPSSEAYEIVIRDGRIVVSAFSPTGLFHGLSSLRQLLFFASPDGVRESVELPAVCIRDEPRFSWRGMMLDSSRHIFPVGEIKRFIDVLALYKFNIFHWHLTDDQGWRLEIQSRPRLTDIGAWRAESPLRTDPEKGDGIPYGGYYTQAEIRDVVRYARERFITVMPEIELPGHASAAVAAYPELGVNDVPEYAPRVMTRWGVFEYVYAPKPETFQFFEDVFGEVLGLFDSPYIHVGGDEAMRGKECWQKSASCQAFMRENRLASVDHLQSYFIRYAEDLLARSGRRLIGWDEIIEGGLSQNATVMAWRNGACWGKDAAQLGHDVIMAPTSHVYFDRAQDAGSEEPAAFPGAKPIDLEKVYSLDPIPATLPEQFHSYIRGAEGQLWSEYLWDWPKVEYMSFPRACALGEVLWSGPDPVRLPDFKVRLRRHSALLDALGVNYCRRGIE